MYEPKRKLKVNMIELEAAFEHHDEFELSYCLDLEMGEVVMITREDGSNLEDVRETYVDTETVEVDWANVLPQLDLPYWQKDSLVITDQVETGFGKRFIRIPHVESREGYEDMADFIDTVTNPYLQVRLERAISGRSPFRRFKDALQEYPNEREHWFQFKDERMHQRILDWLEGMGIELV